MAISKKTALGSKTKSKYPKASNQPAVTKKDLDYTLPALESILDASTERNREIRLTLNDKSILVAKAYPSGNEELLLYRPKGDAYVLNGFNLLNDKIEERRYGQVPKIGKSIEESSLIFNYDWQIKEADSYIKELQALVEEFKEPLKDFELTPIREYK